MAESNAGGKLFVGELAVSATGTAEAISSTRLIRSILIIAKAANTGQVYIGGADIATATNDGLDAGQSIEFSWAGGMDMALIFVDVDTNGEGVDFYALSG
jgi:hypothetical protein